eukprot:SAG31_NODE_39903_length_284_cov_1.383784_1_plen_33_part_01
MMAGVHVVAAALLPLAAAPTPLQCGNSSGWWTD